MKSIFSFFAAIVAGCTLMAQPMLSLPFLSDAPMASLVQPATHAQFQSGQYGLVLNGGYELGSNALTFQNIFLESGTITNEMKDRIIADMEAPTQLRLGLRLEGTLYGKIGKVPLSLSYRNQQVAWLNFGQPHTLGLVLYGNVQYAGTEISDQDVRYQLASYQEIAVGSGYAFGKLSVGGRVKLLLGNAYSELDPFSYSLLTESLGTQIDFSGNYALFQGSTTNTPVGVGLDLGLTYGTDSTWKVGVALNDLGQIGWDGDVVSGNFDLEYEGFDVVEFASLADGTNFIAADTLRELVFPDTTVGRQVQTLPARVMLHGQYRLGSNLIGASAILGLTDVSIGQPSAMLNVMYQRSLFPFLNVGVNAFVGDITRWGVGAMLSGNIDIGKIELGYIAQMENASGYVLPTSGQGASWSLGLRIGLK
ncbi:MAG: DUF5723 family protein [Bacteroidota bacterium]